jgi:peroxiredoxin Q/BCP
MPIPAEGDHAPNFTLATDSGEDFTLSAQLGHPVVLFFYPEDNTDGCTVENIEFTQLKPEFDAIGARLLGISPDSVKKHCDFRDKFDLKAPLGADPDHVAIEAYGVWGPKTTFGNDYTGLIRTTVLIAPDGRIAKIWTVARVKNHAAEVLEAARALVG